MKRPTLRRDNVKVREVLPPPGGIDLDQVAESCRYVGSPYHKDRPGFAGMPVRRPDASLCPSELADCRDLVEQWLRAAVLGGRTGKWEGGFPRYVWHREGDIVFEAKQGSPGSGDYHGYPLDSWQTVRGFPR